MKALVRKRSDEWERPAAVDQGELFGRPPEEVLAQANVSPEELEDWRSYGWISWDVREVGSVDESQICELLFVRNIARSGLSRAQINVFLDHLDKPYCYDPYRVAFSFAYGWVQLPLKAGTVQLHEYMRANFDIWIGALEEVGNRATLELLRSGITKAMARLNDTDRPENHEDS